MLTMNIPNITKHEQQTRTRYENGVIECAKKQLSYPEYQADAIARHYTSLALVALTLRRMLSERRYSNKCPEADKLIDYLVLQIKEKHRNDFGLELEWPKV